MGDPTHLERMGRELKCPICWSLLSSAVSLTCNHVFCNPCIEKSMKSGSNCPVCKVPFRRREVRPAPHMDNLVTIYKSMEVASGINIFVTQNVPIAKLTDEERQCEVDANSGEKDPVGTLQNPRQMKKTLKEKDSRRKTEASVRSSGVDPVKPCFPTKKRVQVPQSPLSETPLRLAKSGSSLRDVNKGMQKGLVMSKEKPPRSQNETVLSPFFWLREGEDEEKSSQRTNEDQLNDTATPNVPSFSDLKDSDDENHSRGAPLDEAQDKARVDMFDSEMFEWTQRPCSPELCSSPLKMQVADSQKFDINQGKNLVAASNSMEANQLSAENTKFETSKQDNGLTVCIIVGSSQIKSADEKNGLNISRKRSKMAQSGSKKQSKKHKDPVTEINVDSNRLSKANEEQIMNGIEKSNLKKTTERGESKTNTKQMLKTSCAVSDMSGVGDAEAMIVNDSATSPCKQTHGKDSIANNDSRKSQRKRQRLSYVQNIHDESSKLENQTDNNNSLPSSISSLQLDNNKKNAGSKLIKSNAKKSTSSNRELMIPVQPKEKGLCNTDRRDLNDSSKEEHCSSMTEVVLRKCENHIQKNQCAFCLSSEESEASGELLRYCNGRPVAVDYEGGSRVIHSHKNCTEWAPNVYFEDDVAVNLEAEITRSRKIKCGFCGLKGAALGCYEKSCRRSFHVPCAKWTSHCRWDMDKFVMLCPVHASLKLPCESSGSEKRGRTDRGQSYCRLNDDAGKYGTARSHNRTTHGSHKKIVLCCSALSVQERDIVKEFEGVSKVSVLKTWDSNVTHVVASTDETGACKRTLKVLLGILEGKWILNMEWIKASVKAMEPVNEELYEITVDVHGVQDGPRLGRLRVLNKQPKLFEGYEFYFMADFLPSYKGYLHNLVTAAGGIVLHRKPLSGDQKVDTHQSQTLIIYSLELPDKCDPSKKDTIFSCRQSEAEALANSTGSKVASNLWVLNSIAGCKLQNLAK